MRAKAPPRPANLASLSFPGIWIQRARRAVWGGAYRLGLDRLAFRLWRYSPSSLLTWYGHHRFDRAFAVETRGYSDFRYEPTPADRFKEMIASLPLAPEDFLFIDIGSGKGKVVLMAAELPFRKVIGVELWPDLHQIARDNVSRYRTRRELLAAVELVLMDAALYPIPNDPAVLYFFNPFGEDVLRQVLRNLEASLEHHQRQVFIVFYATSRRGAPWDRRRLLDEACFLKPIRDERHCTVYSSR